MDMSLEPEADVFEKVALAVREMRQIYQRCSRKWDRHPAARSTLTRCFDQSISMLLDTVDPAILNSHSFMVSVCDFERERKTHPDRLVPDIMNARSLRALGSEMCGYVLVYCVISDYQYPVNTTEMPSFVRWAEAYREAILFAAKSGGLL